MGIITLATALISLLGGVMSGEGGGAIQVISIAQACLKVDHSEAALLILALQVTLPVAYFLAIANFFVGWGNDMIFERGQEEPVKTLIKAGIWLMIAVLAINHVEDLIGAFMGLYNTAATKAVEISSDIIGTAEAYDEMASESGPAGAMISVMMTIIGIFGWLLQLLSTFAVVFICYSAKVEFLLRLAFTPLGLSKLADQESHQTAMIYLRKMLVAAIQCIAIILALSIGNAAISATIVKTLVQDSIGDIGSLGPLSMALFALVNSFIKLVVPFAAIGAVSVAKTALSEAIAN